MLTRTRNGNGALMDPFTRMTAEMDRLFDTFSPRLARPEFFGARTENFAPPVHIWEDENTIFVDTELPGVPMDNVEVLASNESLTIRGRRESTTPENTTSHHIERFYGAFERTLTLPTEIDVERVSASLDNGVLRIALPKADVGARQRRIEITPGAPQESTKTS